MNDDTQKQPRWVQRLESFDKALLTLHADIQLATDRQLSDIEKRGMIQAFEYCYELAWNVIKDFFKAQGDANIFGSRDAFQLAFNRELIASEILMETIKSQQQTVHTYHQEIADEIFYKIRDNYYDAFQELSTNLRKQIKP